MLLTGITQMENVLKNECWRRIYWDINNDPTKYFISNTGKVLNIETGKFLEARDGNSGYLAVGLNHKGQQKTLRIHRLVACAFIPNYYLKPEVNHIDGNKYNNHYTNLEWVTSSENRQHALRTGLLDKRAEHRLCDSEVRDVCRLIEEGNMNVSQIARIIGCDRATVSKILHGKIYKNISKGYNFKNFATYDTNVICGDNAVKTKYSDDDIRKVCELIDEGKYELREIEKMTGVPYQTIRNVYYGTCRKSISKNYNFMKSKSNVLHDKKVLLVRKACALLDTGYNTKEVAEMTGLPRPTVRGILSGYTWQEVSREYGFMQEKLAKDSALMELGSNK